jgi:hypothetical protein
MRKAVEEKECASETSNLSTAFGRPIDSHGSDLTLSGGDTPQ